MKNILITPEGIKTNLKNVKPLEAICEYIWNGFDAGASQIKVYLHTNELGLINKVLYTMNCHINFSLLMNLRKRESLVDQIILYLMDVKE